MQATIMSTITDKEVWFWPYKPPGDTLRFYFCFQTYHKEPCSIKKNFFKEIQLPKKKKKKEKHKKMMEYGQTLTWIYHLDESTFLWVECICFLEERNQFRIISRTNMLWDMSKKTTKIETLCLVLVDNLMFQTGCSKRRKREVIIS